MQCLKQKFISPLCNNQVIFHKSRVGSGTVILNMWKFSSSHHFCVAGKKKKSGEHTAPPLFFSSGQELALVRINFPNFFVQNLVTWL